MPSSYQAFTRWALLLSILQFSGHVSAQAPLNALPPQAKERAEDHKARELFLRGDRFFQQGAYERAVKLFQESYDLSHRPELLFNLANAYERLARYEDALQALEDYAPHAPLNEEYVLQQRMNHLRARADAKYQQELAAAPKPPPVAAEPVPKPTPQARTLEHLPSRPPPQPNASGTSALEVVGYALLGAGALTLTSGVLLGLDANHAQRAAEQRCNGVCPSAAENDVNRAGRHALLADVLWGSTAALVGTGLALLLVSGTEDEEEHVAARLMLQPRTDGGEVSVAGSFE